MENNKYFNGLVTLFAIYLFGFKTYYLLSTLYYVFTNLSKGDQLFNAMLLYFFGYYRTILYNVIYGFCNVVKNWKHYKNKLNAVLEEIENIRQDQEKLKEQYTNLEDMPSEERESFELKNSLLNIYDIFKKRYTSSRSIVTENSTVSTVYQYLVVTKDFFNSETYHNLTTQVNNLLESGFKFCYNKVTSDPRAKKYIDQTLTFVGYAKTYVNPPIKKPVFKIDTEKFKESMSFNSGANISFGDPEKMQEDLAKFSEALESLSQLSNLANFGNLGNLQTENLEEMKKNI